MKKKHFHTASMCQMSSLSQWERSRTRKRRFWLNSIAFCNRIKKWIDPIDDLVVCRRWQWKRVCLSFSSVNCNLVYLFIFGKNYSSYFGFAQQKNWLCHLFSWVSLSFVLKSKSFGEKATKKLKVNEAITNHVIGKFENNLCIRTRNVPEECNHKYSVWHGRISNKVSENKTRQVLREKSESNSLVDFVHGNEPSSLINRCVMQLGCTSSWFISIRTFLKRLFSMIWLIRFLCWMERNQSHPCVFGWTQRFACFILLETLAAHAIPIETYLYSTNSFIDRHWRSQMNFPNTLQLFTATFVFCFFFVFAAVAVFTLELVISRLKLF